MRVFVIEGVRVFLTWLVGFEKERRLWQRRCDNILVVFLFLVVN